MIVYLGNQKLNTIYSGNKEMITTPLLPEELTIEYIVVGGGGASGGSEYQGVNPAFTVGSGGGGGGGVISGSLTLSKRGISYPVIVGRGGRPTAGVTGSNGENGLSSSLYTFAVAGGGGGAMGSGSRQFNLYPPVRGNDGANGGGGGVSGSGGNGGAGFGYNGGAGYWPLGIIAGGGAGAGGAGSILPGSSGSGSIWLDGLEYAIGGCGDGSSYCRNYSGSGKALYGNGGPGTVNNPPNSGSNGVVIIRYPGTGSQLIGGDSVYYSGSYTYHRFSTVGTSSLYY